MNSRVCIAGLLLVIIALAGCWGDSSDSDDAPAAAQSDPPVGDVPASTGGGATPSLDSATALVRSAGDPDDVLGAAVVIDSDGLLVTSTEAVDGDIELVLPTGDVYAPALVTVQPAYDLALLKIPVDRMTPARIATSRLNAGSEIFATGWDGSPPSLARISGHVTGTSQATDGELRIRGSDYLATDLDVSRGFAGGPVADDDGGLAGLLVPDSETENAAAVSAWVIVAWLEHHEQLLEEIRQETRDWDAIELPNRWSVRVPDGWNVSVASEGADSYRAEFTPADPDVPVQLNISVQPNEFGQDADAFIEDQFAGRSSARIWDVSRLQGRALVRVTMMQEGALVDVGYVLDPDHLIAISMTSGYQPESDQDRVDQARAIFAAALGSVHQSQ